jgi:predicted Zn-dependent peptidase
LSGARLPFRPATPRPALSLPSLAIVLLIVGVSSLAPIRPARAQALEGRVARIALDNGMKFLVVRRGTAPVFSATLRFKVGSVDDPGGASGLAHLFEHLAFKGTSVIGTRDVKQEAEILDGLDRVARDLNRELDKGADADAARLESLRREMKDLEERERPLVVKDELMQILSVNGAAGLNASTNQDLTSYYVSLPSNRLELWCLIESARLRDPILREFYSEREVVKEERRMRIDTQPDGRLYEQLLLTAFQASPYRVSAVGFMSDLERLTRPEAAAFHATYYLPNNAVGALVGDVDPAVAEPLLRRYFGGLTAGPPPPRPATSEPPQQGERRVTVEFDAEPQVLIAFHKPTWPHPDDPVFQVIDSLLTSGRTSRLFRELVLKDQIASDVSSFEAPGDRFPNLFVIGAEPRSPHSVSEVEQGILAELARLSREPAEEREMQKIRNQLEAAFLYPLRSNQGLAGQLSSFEILDGDWKQMIKYRDAVRAVTAAQVQEVARRTFAASNRTVAVLARPHPAPPEPAAAPAAAEAGSRSGQAARGDAR